MKSATSAPLGDGTLSAVTTGTTPPMSTTNMLIVLPGSSSTSMSVDPGKPKPVKRMSVYRPMADGTIELRDVLGKPTEVRVIKEKKVTTTKLLVVLVLLIVILAMYVNVGGTLIGLIESRGDKVVLGPHIERGQLVKELIALIQRSGCNADLTAQAQRVQTDNASTTPSTNDSSTHTEEFPVDERTQLEMDVDVLLLKFQDRVVEIRNDGWRKGVGTIIFDEWNYQQSVLFCASLVTTVGYGDQVPQTNIGRIFTILYSLVGIPLALICISIIGLILAQGFRLIVKFLFKNTVDKEDGSVHVPLWLSLFILFLYLFIGALIFTQFSRGEWDYLEAFYFCYITLTTIGLGDYVYGSGRRFREFLQGVDNITQVESAATYDERALEVEIGRDYAKDAIGSIIYLLVGLSLVSMCFTLMQEEVAHQLRLALRYLKRKMYQFKNAIKKGCAKLKSCLLCRKGKVPKEEEVPKTEVPEEEVHSEEVPEEEAPVP